MSFRSSFSIRKTKPRQFVSRSPLKLPAEELAHELGPRYQTIDARIGNQKMTYDITQANWISGNNLIKLSNIHFHSFLLSLSRWNS